MEENEDVFYQFDNRLNIRASLGKKHYIGTIENCDSTCLFIKTDDGYHYEKVLEGFNKIEYLGEGVYHIQDVDCQWSVLCLNDFETIFDFRILPLVRTNVYWPDFSDAEEEFPKHFSSIRIVHVERPTPMDYGHCYLIGISGGKKYYGLLTICEEEDRTLWYSLDVPIAYDKIVYGDHFAYAEKGQYRHLYCRDDENHDGIPRYIELNEPIQGLQGVIDIERINEPFTRVSEEPYPICNGKTLLCDYYSYRFLLGEQPPIEADSVTRLCLCAFGYVCIDYYVYRIGALYGLWQVDSGVILRCEYNDIQAYIEQGQDEWRGDELLIRRGDKWGVYSIKKKRMIIPPVFDRVLSHAYDEMAFEIRGSFSLDFEGFYVLLDKTYMLIEENGDARTICEEMARKLKQRFFENK